MSISKFDLEQLRNKLSKVLINPVIYGKKLFQFLDYFNIIGSHDSPEGVKYVWSGSQEQYDALAEIRDDTIYFIS